MFELREDKSHVRVAPVSVEWQASARDAEEACPAGTFSREG